MGPTLDDRVDATPAMCRSLRRDGSKRSTQREPVVEAMGQTLDDRLPCLVASHRRGGWPRSASEPLVQAMGLTLDERVQQVEPGGEPARRRGRSRSSSPGPGRELVVEAMGPTLDDRVDSMGIETGPSHAHRHGHGSRHSSRASSRTSSRSSSPGSMTRRNLEPVSAVGDPQPVGGAPVLSALSRSPLELTLDDRMGSMLGLGAGGGPSPYWCGSSSPGRSRRWNAEPVSAVGHPVTGDGAVETG